VIRPGHSTRRIAQDLISGHWELIVEEDTGDTENLSHGLISGETLREVWRIHPDDPLSATVEVTYDQRLSRGEWSVRTRAVSRLESAPTHLRHSARLDAWEGENLALTREFFDNTPRDHV